MSGINKDNIDQTKPKSKMITIIKHINNQHNPEERLDLENTTILMNNKMRRSRINQLILII